MRAGGCAVQQALTAEAAGVVKQAVALAKRRGHAQVTPLHVANTMLAANGGLFRVACQQSHSHPLQCKALELCFNVALNRLPASSSSPMLSPHSQFPSISNALVAAFKRAQAHQRRGSIENQQQPLLAVKIEIEQLIISILDDPSVSRVMREAGFSSTQVKTNVEKAVSLELCSNSSSPSPSTSPTNKAKESIFLTLQPSSPPKINNPISSDQPIRNEDVNIIIQTLLTNRTKKSLVIVGECISNIETIVKGLMDKVDRGFVPEDLKEVKFISIPPLYSFCNLHRDEVEQKIGELTCLVKSLVSKGVVLYLGDLKWISDYRVNLEQEKNYYCSVEHMIMEIGRLVCAIGDVGKFWLMGIATFQTYMRCRSGYHSLENIWGLHPVTIPSNTLGLSLIPDQSDEQELKLNCCADCSAKFENEARDLQTGVSDHTIEPTLSSSLPPWLKDESRRRKSSNYQNSENSIKELCKKWNSHCSSSAHKLQLIEKTLNLSSVLSPSSSTSCFSFDQIKNPNFTQLPENLESDPSSTPNSTSSSDIMETDQYTPKFKEFSAENLKILCNALEKKVPSQKEIIPQIIATILQSRCGMLKRKGDISISTNVVKEETWMFFLGLDSQAKEKVSRELAKVVFGSYSNYVTIGLTSSFFLSGRNKRGRDEESSSGYLERFYGAVCANPHRVIYVEDLDLADYRSRLGIKRAIQSGKIRGLNGEEVCLCDAIVVLSCERFGSCRSRAGSPNSKQKVDEDASCTNLDLNMRVGKDEDHCVVDDVGILESVDRRVLFKVQDLIEQ